MTEGVSAREQSCTGWRAARLGVGVGKANSVCGEALETGHVWNPEVVRAVEWTPIDSPIVNDKREDVVVTSRAEFEIDIESLVVEWADIDQGGPVELLVVIVCGYRIGRDQAAFV